MGKIDFSKYVKDDTLMFELRGADIVFNSFRIRGLVDFLQHRTDITSLVLFSREIQPEDTDKLTELTQLTKLTLLGRHICDREFSEKLAKLTKLTKLDLPGYGLDCQDAKGLAKLTNLTELDLSSNAISNEGIKELAKLTNLTELNLSSNAINNEGIKELAKLTNLTELNLSSNAINNEGIKELAKLTNLTKLSLSHNAISNEDIKELAKLTNLTELDLSYSKIDVECIEALARSQGFRVKLRPGATIFYDFLSRAYSNNQVIGEQSVKRVIFDMAQRDNQDESIVRYILEHPNKYPFLVNSKDEQGHTLYHYYTHAPFMERFLFKHGLIPSQELERDTELQNILQDGQSVHASSIVRKTHFFAKKLVESTKASKEQLKQAAASYVESIGLLKQYQNCPIRLRLLSLTDNEKRSVMKKTLSSSSSIPNDKEFIKAVIDKVEQALAQQYLRKNCQGEYDQGYSTEELQYDYTRDDAKVTIPESIAYIKLLIDNFFVPLKEKKELLVTLMEQNPGLVKEKLSAVRVELGNSDVFDKEQFNKAELHELLNGIDNNGKIDKLFKEISGLDIEKTWREQKEFVLLKQIYVATTTYGENNSACIQGVWSQIIDSINEISSKIVAQYDHYLKERQEQEMQKGVITKENIKPFIEKLANWLVTHAKFNTELKESLEDFAVGIVDIDNPEKITFEQQKILAEINEYFTITIRDSLQNYRKYVPKKDEYDLIIKGLLEVAVIQNFVKANSGVLNQQRINISALQENDIQNNNQQSSNHNKDGNAPHSTQKSKLPIAVASALAIAGIISGVAIAVYLGMLAAGIAVGACCLVAAVIVYYCNKPSKSLENSNAEAVVNQTTVQNIT